MPEDLGGNGASSQNYHVLEVTRLTMRVLYFLKANSLGLWDIGKPSYGAAEMMEIVQSHPALVFVSVLVTFKT